MKPGSKSLRTRQLEDVGESPATSMPEASPTQSEMETHSGPPKFKTITPHHLALSAAIVGGAFVLSRVLGLVREAVIASRFGTTSQYDVYVTAFGIPDTLFLIIIGGAVGSAFIPVFTGLMSKGKESQAWHLASTLMNASVVLLSLGGIIMGLAAPALVGAIILPARPPDQQQLAVGLTRVLLLSPLFMGLGGWAMGILNARQHFLLPAIAPIAYNLSIIAGALFLAPTMGVFGLAWGVVAGALLHFGVQLPGLVRVGMRYSFRLKLSDEGVKQVGLLMLPRILGQGAFQVNIIAMRSIGSFLAAGRIAAFNYAYLLMILPHGVFALSLATVTFPTMAAQYAEKDLDGLRRTLARAVRVLLFLVIPSAVGLLMLRSQIVVSIFQFGAFKQSSTELVASALGYFALGLVAYAVVEVLTRAYYALHDTRTPVMVSLVTVALNLGLAAWLALGLGMSQDGLALSLAATTTLEMVLLWVLLGRKLPEWRLSNDGLVVSIARSVGAALVMGGALALLVPALNPLAQALGNDKLAASVVTVLGVGVGAIVYLGAARLLRSEEIDEATGLLLRRFRRNPT